jgi:hypothetical protein
MIEDGCIKTEVVEGRSNVIGVAWIRGRSGGLGGEEGKIHSFIRESSGSAESRIECIVFQ